MPPPMYSMHLVIFFHTLVLTSNHSSSAPNTPPHLHFPVAHSRGLPRVGGGLWSTVRGWPITRCWLIWAPNSCNPQESLSAQQSHLQVDLSPHHLTKPGKIPRNHQVWGREPWGTSACLLIHTFIHSFIYSLTVFRWGWLETSSSQSNEHSSE